MGGIVHVLQDDVPGTVPGTRPVQPAGASGNTSSTAGIEVTRGPSQSCSPGHGGLLAVTVDEDRLHADAPRALELVVRAVADEHRLVRLDTEQLAAVHVDPRVGLREPHGVREDLRVEEPRQLRLGEDDLDVLAADGDQPDAEAALAQGAQRLDDAGSRYERAPGVVEPQRADVLDRLVRNADAAQGVADRADVPRIVRRVPAAVKLVGLETGAAGHRLQHVRRRLAVPVDERLPEVEDDRLDHAAHRFKRLPRAADVVLRRAPRCRSRSAGSSDRARRPAR